MLLHSILGLDFGILDAIVHALYFALSLSYHAVLLLDRRLQPVDVHVEEEALEDLAVLDGFLLLFEHLLHLLLFFLELFDCLLFLSDSLLMFVVEARDFGLVLFLERGQHALVLLGQLLGGLLLLGLELISYSLEMLTMLRVEVVEIVLVLFVNGGNLTLILLLHFADSLFVVGLHVCSFLLEYFSLVLEALSSFFEVGLELCDLLFVLLLDLLELGLSVAFLVF